MSALPLFDFVVRGKYGTIFAVVLIAFGMNGLRIVRLVNFDVMGVMCVCVMGVCVCASSLFVFGSGFGRFEL